jgi:formylglycine-generating enzyme required for sulfatase activity
MRILLLLAGIGLFWNAMAVPGRAEPVAHDLGSPPPSYGMFFSIAPPGGMQVPTTAPMASETEALSDHELEQMVEVPAGVFLMGADEGFADERPQRQVYVKRFWIDKYEVTNQRFRAVGMRPAVSFGAQYEQPRLPVVGVTWLQAGEYCRRLGKRLPTEAEWEKAARGTDGRYFPWGNFWDPALANDGHGPRPVGSYPDGASPYGALDMAGNVWEWVEDQYITLAVASRGQERRVLRGGSWNYAAVFMRTSYRRHERPDYVEQRIGFRCVKETP